MNKKNIAIFTSLTLIIILLCILIIIMIRLPIQKQASSPNPVNVTINQPIDVNNSVDETIKGNPELTTMNTQKDSTGIITLENGDRKIAHSLLTINSSNKLKDITGIELGVDNFNSSLCIFLYPDGGFILRSYFDGVSIDKAGFYSLVIDESYINTSDTPTVNISFSLDIQTDTLLLSKDTLYSLEIPEITASNYEVSINGFGFMLSNDTNFDRSVRSWMEDYSKSLSQFTNGFTHKASLENNVNDKYRIIFRTDMTFSDNVNPNGTYSFGADDQGNININLKGNIYPMSYMKPYNLNVNGTSFWPIGVDLAG